MRILYINKKYIHTSIFFLLDLLSVSFDVSSNLNGHIFQKDLYKFYNHKCQLTVSCFPLIKLSPMMTFLFPCFGNVFHSSIHLFCMLIISYFLNHLNAFHLISKCSLELLLLMPSNMQ